MKFDKYMQLREGKEKDSPKGVGSKVTLGDGNDFEPLHISDDMKSEHYGKNANLAPIIRAFKAGANWGWSKDDKTGEDKPVKISGKKLYLTGAAVRDHLKSKTPKKFELVTNASPDEIYKILSQNDFDFVGTEDEAPKTAKKPMFWISKKSKNGRPFGFTIKIKDQIFGLNVFTKNDKGKDPDDDYEIGTHIDDAGSRDFGINAMSIPLTNDNGPNKDILDFFGGMHDLTNGTVNSIGDINKSLEKDPMRGFRFVRMLSRYGNPKKVNGDQKSALQKIAKKLKSGDLKVDGTKAIEEFLDGLENDDVDKKSYLDLYNGFGLSDILFPNMALQKELPKEIAEVGDHSMPLAWMLQGNDPSTTNALPPEIGKKVACLLKSFGLDENIDPDSLMDLLYSYNKAGISSKKFKEWLTKLAGKDGNLADAFIQYSKMPRIKAIIVNEMGEEQPEPGFEDLFDPFTNKLPQNAIHELDNRKKRFEHINFINAIKDLLHA